jgi:hypothetical protein
MASIRKVSSAVKAEQVNNYGRQPVLCGVFGPAFALTDSDLNLLGIAWEAE